MMRRLILTLAFLAAATCAAAQPAITGAVQTPGGQVLPPAPIGQFSQGCNAGGGGVVGQPYSNLDCSEPVEAGGTAYKNITTATTTAVKSGVGFLHALTINTYVASATITIYDNTAASGTKIGTITLPSTITADAPVTLTFDVGFATGLTIVTSGATDVTVSYR
jgi:hypothetical protein